MIAAFAAVRWLHEASLMLLFGMSALGAMLHARLPALALPRLAALRTGAAFVALAAAILWLAFAAAQMAGDPAAMANPATLRLAAFATLFGHVFLLRAALLLLLLALVLRGARDALVALTAGAALALLAVTSHAAEAGPAQFAAIGMIADALHLLTAGFWIGSLVLLAALLARKPAQLAQAVGLFAERGMVAVAVLLLTGALNATTILLGGEGHDMLPYLCVLAAKLALVAAMLALAWFNHFRLLPRLADPEAARRLGIHVRSELALGLAAVLLASLLGLLPPTA